MPEMIQFTSKINCETCKHGYATGVVDDYDEICYCELCRAGNCHICASVDECCPDHCAGEIPAGKRRIGYD